MRTYLFAVQDDAGREVCSGEAKLDRVSEVSAVKVDDTVVRIVRGDEIVAAGESSLPLAELHFLRWPAQAKESTPVRKRVDTVNKRQ